MKDLNLLHAHVRDSHLSFDEAEHRYTIDGDRYDSVTTIVEQCFEPFDADTWAAKKALQLGMTPEELKAEWEAKGLEARTLGTEMHAKIERHYLGYENERDNTYCLFERFEEEYRLQPYRTEWAIFDEDCHVAGTLDFLELRDGVFNIYDWKRSNKLVFNGKPIKETPWNKKALAPVENLNDTTYWHYALQVSIYRLILEKHYDIRVANGYLGVFHPDNHRPYRLEVPNLREEAIRVLEYHRVRLGL